jgi:hypothetical protein
MKDDNARPRLPRHAGWAAAEFNLVQAASHILIRCSTRRSTIRRATDFCKSECGMLPK